MSTLVLALSIAGAGVLFGFVFDFRNRHRSWTPGVPPRPPEPEATLPPWAPTPSPAVDAPPTELMTPAPPFAEPTPHPASSPPPFAEPPPGARSTVPLFADPQTAVAGPASAPFVAVTSPTLPTVQAVPAATAAGVRPASPPTRTDALLVCRGVHVAYDQVPVLFGVDLEVGRDEIVALLGTNGAGKSTLLKAVSGIVRPFEGSIHFDGRDITQMGPVARAKMGIVQVPGGRAIFPTLTVAEHFKAAGWLFTNEDPAEIRARTDKVLALFPRLEERWHQLAGNLSGGEQQQLGLGMAFVAKPRLLIIDELSLGLAPTVVEQLLGIVRAIHAEDCPVILVEQSVNVALTIADRAYFMEKGEIRFEGPADELLDRPDVLRSAFLEGAVQAGTDAGTAAPKATVTVGFAYEPSTRLLALEDRPAVLRVRGLTKHFGGISAVDDVSFDVRQGEALGFIGPNGAGKTTIFDLISGVLASDGGRIELLGTDITNWSPDRRAVFGLGRSFQDARIFPSLTVIENIALGLERHVEVRDHLASLLDLPAVQESEQHVRLKVGDLIDLMGLGAYRDKFVSELSTGVRRIVDLSMAIAHEPTVLLLDEPSSGIAQRECEALGLLLTRIQQEMHCSLLVIEHDMPLVSGVCDEIIALELGAVIVRGTPAEVLSDPLVLASYLGDDTRIVNRSGSIR